MSSETVERPEPRSLKGDHQAVRLAYQRWYRNQRSVNPWTAATNEMVTFFASPEGQAALAAFRGDGPQEEGACERHHSCVFKRSVMKSHDRLDELIGKDNGGRVEERINVLAAQRDAAQAEVDRLRGAIRRAGFAVMETSGDWSIHDVSELGKAEADRTARVVADNVMLEGRCKDLEAEVERLKEIQEGLAERLGRVNDACKAKGYHCSVDPADVIKDLSEGASRVGKLRNEERAKLACVEVMLRDAETEIKRLSKVIEHREEDVKHWREAYGRARNELDVRTKGDEAVGGWTEAHEALTAANAECPEAGVGGVVKGIEVLADRVAELESKLAEAERELASIREECEGWKALAEAREKNWIEAETKRGKAWAFINDAWPKLHEALDEAAVPRPWWEANGCEYLVKRIKELASRGQSAPRPLPPLDPDGLRWLREWAERGIGTFGPGTEAYERSKVARVLLDWAEAAQPAPASIESRLSKVEAAVAKMEGER